MELVIPHLNIKNMFESNPLKSRFLVRQLTAYVDVRMQTLVRMHAGTHACTFAHGRDT